MHPYGTHHKHQPWEGPAQPKAIRDDQATKTERDRCLAILADCIDAVERGELRSLTKRGLLVHVYRKTWGMRPVLAWMRQLNDTETHPERLRCMAAIEEIGHRVGRGELDHVSRRDLLAQVFERVRDG